MLFLSYPITLRAPCLKLAPSSALTTSESRRDPSGDAAAAQLHWVTDGFGHAVGRDIIAESEAIRLAGGILFNRRLVTFCGGGVNGKNGIRCP